MHLLRPLRTGGPASLPPLPPRPAPLTTLLTAGLEHGVTVNLHGWAASGSSPHSPVDLPSQSRQGPPPHPARPPAGLTTSPQDPSSVPSSLMSSRQQPNSAAESILDTPGTEVFNMLSDAAAATQLPPVVTRPTETLASALHGNGSPQTDSPRSLGQDRQEHDLTGPDDAPFALSNAYRLAQSSLSSASPDRSVSPDRSPGSPQPAHSPDCLPDAAPRQHSPSRSPLHRMTK